MPNTDLPPTDDFSYAMNPAGTFSLNINLTSLPKCPRQDCSGELLPVYATSNPKSGTATIFVCGWQCSGCNNNFMYNAGKLFTQPILIETNQTL
jgi:hypothetical protein